MQNNNNISVVVERASNPIPKGPSKFQRQNPYDNPFCYKCQTRDNPQIFWLSLKGSMYRNRACEDHWMEISKEMMDAERTRLSWVDALTVRSVK